MRFSALLVLALVPLFGCETADAAPADAGAPETVASGQEAATILVYKSPTCGCCNGWVEHLEDSGFTVDARNTNDVMSVKRDSGIPVRLSSCHTAIIDGYVVEGHVPADQIRRLLADRPDVAGIAVPGMPIGSPGMEGPGASPYDVLAFTHDGTTSVFATVDPR
jgi:hypothetical protein